LPPVQLVHSSTRRRGIGAAALLTFVGLGALLVLLLGPSSATAAGCPSFRVLHNDRIGPAVLPAGPYTLTPAAGSGITCPMGSKLFARFLEDYDGVLPRPWRVVAEGSGRASFKRGGQLGFSVARSGGGGGGGGNNPTLGKLCPGTFTVNASTSVGALFFRKGPYLLYLPTGSNMPCRRAAGLFTRFLGQPGGRLPFPWRLKNQTATFYKPEHPVRSAFRVEPANGAGPS
jgi:hypothetical protein